MERGVVVGGLMICGSFLLAASLNRSAVKETPTDEPAAQRPMTPPMPMAPVEAEPASCAPEAVDSAAPVPADEPVAGELPGNVREDCSR